VVAGTPLRKKRCPEIANQAGVEPRLWVIWPLNKVVTVIAGDFNTDPTDPRFAEEKTFGMLRQKFEWVWENVPLSERRDSPGQVRLPRCQL
jgi:hypothetical protein